MGALDTRPSLVEVRGFGRGSGREGVLEQGGGHSDKPVLNKQQHAMQRANEVSTPCQSALQSLCT